MRPDPHKLSEGTAGLHPALAELVRLLAQVALDDYLSERRSAEEVPENTGPSKEARGT